MLYPSQENLRFRHPGRALQAFCTFRAFIFSVSFSKHQVLLAAIQVGQAAPEGGFEGGNVEDRVLADDQPTKAGCDETKRKHVGHAASYLFPSNDGVEVDTSLYGGFLKWVQPKMDGL
jgi:hypothetical protein